MNGRRLLRRLDEGIVRAVSSLANDDLSCKKDANTVAAAAMIAARTPSDITKRSSNRKRYHGATEVTADGGAGACEFARRVTRGWVCAHVAEMRRAWRRWFTSQDA